MPPVMYRLQTVKSVNFRGGETTPVAQPHDSYNMMAARWELIDDILGGTDQMRMKGERWLPRESNEGIPQYRLRLARSFLYNALRDTVEKLVAKPFCKVVTVDGGTTSTTTDVNGNDNDEQSFGNEMLDAIEEDVDKTGLNLTQFGRTVFEDGVKYGKAHVLVDYPAIDNGEETAAPPTLADDRNKEMRPLFLRIDPRDLIGWRSERDAGGEERLTQIRIMELRTRPVGDYGVSQIQCIRVINAPSSASDFGTWELWEQTDKGFTKADSGTHSFPGIPLITMYFKRTRFMESEPPLQDLAEMNLCHWHSSSDQRNVLRFTRFGMIGMTGVTAEEMEKPTTVAPNYAFKSANENAKFFFVESTGAAIKAGEEDLGKIEDRMTVLGLQPLVEKHTGNTATGKKINEGKTETAIMSWIRSTEELILNCYKAAAQWINTEVGKDASVDVFSEFAVLTADIADLTLLLQMRIAGEITRETFLAEIKRRGLLADSVDPAEEADKASAEASTFAGQVFAQPGAPGAPGGAPKVPGLGKGGKGGNLPFQQPGAGAGSGGAAA